MTRARNLANLGNKNAITADIGLFNIGIGSTQPHDYKLEVVGGDAYIGGGVTITGNLSVGGTVTYEDVTNVDAVGIITANKGVNIVGGGLTCVGIATFFGDLQAQGDVSIVDTIYHSGDTNTKIRFPGADTFSVDTGGTTRFLIDSNGNIGFNATPASSGTIYDTVDHFIAIGDSDTAIAQDGDGQLELWSNNTEVANFGSVDGYTSTLPITTTNASVTIGDSIIHSGDTNTKIRFPAADTFAVETAGNEALRVDSNGRLLVGANGTTGASFGSTPLALFESSTTNNYGRLGLIYNGADQHASAITFGKSRGTSDGSNTVAQADDQIGSLFFHGADGTDKGSRAAAIMAFVDGTPGSNDMPGRLTFLTTADGAASPTERLRINSSGNLKIGNTADRDLGGLSVQRLHIEGTDGGSSAIGLVNNQNSTGQAAIYFSKSRGTSVNSNTVLQSGDPMGALVFCGSDGSDMVSVGAEIRTEVDGTPGSNDMPGRIVFKTTADGSSSTTERMRLDQGGNLILGGTSAQAADAVTLRQDGEVTAPGFYFSNNIGSAMNTDGIRRATTNTIVVDTNSTERLRIDATGCVGINTSVTNSRYLTVSTIASSNTVQEATFRTENWEDGTHADGWSKNGIQISNSAKTNAGDNVINYIKFSGRAPELNGAHGGNGFITWRCDTGVQSTYGTSRMDIFQRNAAAYSFDGDPGVNPSYWQSSLLTIKSNGNIGVANTNPESKVEISASASPTITMSYTNGTKYGAWESATDFNTFYGYNGAGIRFSSHSGTSYACSWYIDEPHQNFVNASASPVYSGTQNNRSIALPNVTGTSNSYRRFSTINSYLEGSGGITGRVNDGNGARWMSIVPMGYPGTGGGITSGGGWAINVSTNTYSGYDQTFNNTPAWYFHGAGALTPAIDDTQDLGSGTFRLDDIYATNSTIQTSDENDKQDIAELTTAEKAVAVRLKALMRTYKFKKAVAKKGSSARIHCGTTAQLVKDAFAAESLDVTKYALWCENTWYTDSNGDQVMPTEINGTEYPPGSTKNVKLGIRYSEMFAFIISTL